MSIIASIDGLRSEVSESELSETLNTTAFDTATHATAGDLVDTETAGDLVEIGGETYLWSSQSIAQPITVQGPLQVKKSALLRQTVQLWQDKHDLSTIVEATSHIRKPRGCTRVRSQFHWKIC
jgi:hypothetical protein